MKISAAVLVAALASTASATSWAIRYNYKEFDCAFNDKVVSGSHTTGCRTFNNPHGGYATAALTEDIYNCAIYFYESLTGCNGPAIIPQEGVCTSLQNGHYLAHYKVLCTE